MSKSRGRKNKSKNRRAPLGTRQPDTPLQPKPRPPLLERSNQAWWIRAAKWIGATTVTGLGLLATIAGLWGTPWPTAPVFSAGPPSYGAATDVPFQVENKSAVFGLSDLRVSCKVSGIAQSKTSSSFIKLGSGMSFLRQGANYIAPLSSAPYTCPLRGKGGVDNSDAADVLQNVEISFATEYRIFSWLPGQFHAEDGPFTWITTTTPPHWERGEPLK